MEVNYRPKEREAYLYFLKIYCYDSKKHKNN